MLCHRVVFFKDASGCSRSIKAAGIYTQGALQCLRPDAPGYGRLGRRVCHSQLSVVSLCSLPFALNPPQVVVLDGCPISESRVSSFTKESSSSSLSPTIAHKGLSDD